MSRSEPVTSHCAKNNFANNPDLSLSFDYPILVKVFLCLTLARRSRSPRKYVFIRVEEMIKEEDDTLLNANSSEWCARICDNSSQISVVATFLSARKEEVTARERDESEEGTEDLRGRRRATQENKATACRLKGREKVWEEAAEGEGSSWEEKTVVSFNKNAKHSPKRFF